MPYFKDSKNALWFLDADADPDEWLPSDCVAISDDEAYVLQNPPRTDAQVIAQYEAALDDHLDAVAQADRWRDRFTFAIRAGYENQWQAKAKAFGTWMDDCNAQAYSLLAAVSAGTADLPTVEDFIAAMPPAPVLQ